MKNHLIEEASRGMFAASIENSNVDVDAASAAGADVQTDSLWSDFDEETRRLKNQSSTFCSWMAVKEVDDFS